MNKSDYTSLKYDINNVGQKLVKHQLFCNSKPETSLVKNKSTASFTSKYREMNNQYLYNYQYPFSIRTRICIYERQSYEIRAECTR